MLSDEEKRLIEEYGDPITILYDLNNSFTPIYSSRNATSLPCEFLTQQFQQAAKAMLQNKFAANLTEVTSHIESKLGVTYQTRVIFMWAALSGDDELLQACPIEFINLKFFEVLPYYPNHSHEGINFNALHCAAFSGSEKCVKWLINNGCEYISEKVDHTNVAWHEIDMHLLPLAKSKTLLSGYMDEIDPAICAALGNHVSILKELRQRRKKFPRTILHATLVTNAECLKYVLTTEEGLACVHSYNQYGKSAFHLAAMEGNVRALNLIMTAVKEEPAFVDHLTGTNSPNRQTATHLAAENGQADVWRYLVTEGKANPTIKDSFGKSSINYIRNHTLLDPSAVILPQLDSMITRTGSLLILKFEYLVQFSELMGGDLLFLKALHDDGIDVLSHPGSRAFLDQIWKDVRHYLYVRTILIVLSVLLTSVLILQTTRTECIRTPFNATNNDTLSEVSDTGPYSIMLLILNFMLLVGTVLCTITTKRAYNSLTAFFLQNTLQIVFVTCTVKFFFNTSASCEWKQNFGSLSVIAGWVYFTHFIWGLDLPFMTRYTAMYTTTLKKFVTVFVSTFFIWLAFGFVYCMHNYKYNDYSSEEVFQDMFEAEIKILGMGAGAEQFVLNSKSIVTVLMYNFFTIFVVICLMTLINNLSIADINRLKNDAKNHKLIRRLEVLLFHQKICRNGIPMLSPNLSDRFLRMLYTRTKLHFPVDKIIAVYLDSQFSRNQLDPDIIKELLNITSTRQNKPEMDGYKSLYPGSRLVLGVPTAATKNIDELPVSLKAKNK